MGGINYKYSVLALVFIILFSLDVCAEEWRHPDCPKDFEGYKEEYGIPRWEFESLFEECYMPKEVYEYRKARDEEYVATEHDAYENEEWAKKTEEAEKQIAEWAKNPPPEPEKLKVSHIPPDKAPPPGSNISAFGMKIKPEEYRPRLWKNRDKIWWLNTTLEEQNNVMDKSSIYYSIQNYKNKLVEKLKFWKKLFKDKE